MRRSSGHSSRWRSGRAWAPGRSRSTRRSPPARPPEIGRRPIAPEAGGTLYVGTSGFGYPGWTPRFYPPGTPGNGLLTHYAATFHACELNATYYRQPGEAAVRAWAAATPPTFRFAIKAQRGGSARAFLVDPPGTLAWLTAPYRLLGERLGAVLFRVPDEAARDDARLDAFLAAWPAELPLVLDLRHPSWHVDETFERLRTAGVVLCATEADEDPEPPTLRLTGSGLYVRLRRSAYEPAAIAAWAARLEPFLAAGHDVFAFFRHDEVGRATEYARALDETVAALRA